MAQLPGPEAIHCAALVAAAVLIACVDLVTIPLVTAPLAGALPRHVLRSAWHEAARPEGLQYLLGFLAALVAEQRPWALLLMVVPVILLYQASKGLAELHDGTRVLLENMADAVDLRDPYTGGHSRRVTAYTAQILRELGMTGPDVSLITSAARVHDIGKIGIPDGILNKPGKLDPQERAVMEQHPVLGAQLLRRYPDFARGTLLVRHHHESWDGQGYPDRLSATAIPFGARVIAVADSFDAMTSDRPYRAGMPVARAAEILREGRGRQWDPAIVDAFLRCLTAGSLRTDTGAPVTLPPPASTEAVQAGVA